MPLGDCEIDDDLGEVNVPWDEMLDDVFTTGIE